MQQRTRKGGKTSSRYCAGEFRRVVKRKLHSRVVTETTLILFCLTCLQVVANHRTRQWEVNINFVYVWFQTYQSQDCVSFGLSVQFSVSKIKFLKNCIPVVRRGYATVPYANLYIKLKQIGIPRALKLYNSLCSFAVAPSCKQNCREE